jgi:lysophospholipase L1-like esterase
MTRALRFLVSCFLLLELCSNASSLRASGGLQSGDVVAICGDSITEQSLYAAFMETYLLACQPEKELRAHQFGLSGETSWEFVRRMEPEVMSFHPTVVTTCYGMNDGGFAPIDPQRQLTYRRATTEIVQKFKNGGVRLIVVGSPGAVDTDSFGAGGPNWIGAEEYNTQTLRGLARIAREVAAEQGVIYADVHGLFCEVMAKAKAKFGSHYHVAGPDGVHPAANGHLIIAYAFLKALGCDGNIGSITVDLAENRATASGGHRVLSFDGELLEIESARYPFCFYGDPHNPDSTRGILEVLPFNAELNRFQLIVTAAPSARLKVTWGEQSKIFLAGQLARGINLAEEFLDNPFSEPFQAVADAVRQQQQYETLGVRGLFPNFGGWEWVGRGSSGDEPDRRVAKARALEAVARAAVKPVKHSLKISAVHVQ